MSSISIIYSSFFSRNNEIESESNDEKQLVNLEHCSIHDVPQEILIYHIFNHLSFNDLCRAACVCRRWSQLISFPDFWDLKRFFSISQILDKQAWETSIDVKKLGLSFDDKECNPRKIACMFEHFTQTVEIENHAGFSYIVLPKGLSLNKLMTIYIPTRFPPFTKNRSFFKQIDPKIIDQIGNHEIEKSQHFIISNSIIKGSRGCDFKEHVKIFENKGYEVPTVLLTTTFLILKYLQEYKNSNDLICKSARCYNDHPMTYTMCSPVGNRPIETGGFSSTGFDVTFSSEIVTDITGIAVAKKITGDSVSA